MKISVPVVNEADLQKQIKRERREAAATAARRKAIEKAVADWPPLTPEQIDRLRFLLAGGRSQR